MIKSIQAICFSSFVLISSASADVTLPAQERFSGDKATKEIYGFMTKHWYRQIWQIEYKTVEGYGRWHIKENFWQVELDGPKHLLKMLDLNKLDKKKAYEFVGVPVDQNYGVITFYAYSPPKVIVAPNNNNAEQGSPRQPATKSRQVKE